MSEHTESLDTASVALPDDGSEPVDGGAVRGATGRGRLAPWIVLAVAVVLGGLFVVLLTAGKDPGENADTPLLGQPAPEATGTLADGTPFDLARRKGSWVVLNFFTADCVPCIQEHPELVKFAETQAGLDDGAELYSIVVNDTPEDVQTFFDDNGGDWPVVYSEHDDFPVAFGVAKVPETWIIDPSGVVQRRIISTVNAEDLNVLMQQYREAYR